MGKKSRAKERAHERTVVEPPHQASSRQAAPALICGSLVVLVFAIYGQVHGHSFINFDDPDYVSNNSHVLSGLTWSGVKWAFTTVHASNWHPLTWISHMIDVQLFGVDAGAHLLVSAGLHACNSVLVFAFLWIATRALWRSATVAALFAVHPLHVESVAWISERKDTLSTLFFLLCLIAYAKYVLENSRAAYIVSVVALALGLMAKPMLVSTPLVLLLLDTWPFQRIDRSNWSKRIVEKIPHALCIVPSILATLLAQREAMPSAFNVPLAARLANAAMSYVKYVTKTLWPTRLSIMYPYPTRISSSLAIACAVIVIAITATAFFYRRSLPWLFVGWLWFVVTLVPVIGIVQVGLQAMADRYTYIPHIGLFLAIVWTVGHFLPQHRDGLATTAAVVILTLAIAVHSQVGYWSNSSSLFAHALSATTTTNKLAHVNLGASLLEKGDYAAAEQQFRQGVGFQPAAIVYNGLATALLKQGKLDAAAEVIAEHPDAGLHNNLAAELAKAGRDDRAVEEYEVALKADPRLYDARLNYGALLSRLGRDSEAEKQFMEAARLQPHSAEPHVYLALLDANGHRFDAAEREIQKAMAIDHDASNKVLINAIRIPPRPAAIDEYLVFLHQQSGGR